MGLFSWLPKKPIDFDSIVPPWDRERTSIYSCIKAHIVPGGIHLDSDRVILPDEEIVSAAAGYSWIAGGRDGCGVYKYGDDACDQAAHDTVDRLQAFLRSGTQNDLVEFYKHMAADYILEYINELVAEMGRRGLLEDKSLRALCMWLAKKAPDREPVKFALALLAFCAQEGDLELFCELGVHEELTYFCAVSMQHCMENSEECIWQFAKMLHGWGRIQAINCLYETSNPEIKKWLLTEGYKNRIAYEQTAYICATVGELLAALSEPRPDELILIGASEIIAALINGGPAEDIESYVEAPQAVHKLMLHLEHADINLSQFLAVVVIKEYVSALDISAGGSAAAWQKVKDPILAACDAILQNPDWKHKVEVMLQREDDPDFNNVLAAASFLDVDTWELLFERVRAGKPYWFHIMKTKDASRIMRVVQFAEETLPLEKIASGPGDELGLSQEFEDRQTLDIVVQGLRHWPGYGTKLIRAALQSPVVRNRNMALYALQEWRREHWEDGIDEQLRELLNQEPNADTAELISTVLAGS